MELTAPEKVGFSSDRLQRLNRYMQGMVDDGKLAGVVTLLARKGEVFHHETFGKQEIESGVPMELDSIFRIYSMSKPIASVALMMLHEEAKFQLDDPLSAYFPEFADLTVATGRNQGGIVLEPLDSPPTVRQLLSHSAGFSYGWFQDTPVDQMYPAAKILSVGSNLESMVERLAKIPLAYQPGTKWRYSVSTDVVGRLVEVLSGQTFDQYLREKIFEPLGMIDTGFHVPEEDVSRLAAVYGPAEGGGIEQAQGPFVRDFTRAPLLFSGGGGLVSTAEDYSRFCQMMLNGGSLNGVRILAPKTVRLMRSNHLPDVIDKMEISEGNEFKGNRFGLGFSVIQDIAKNGIPGSNGNYYWGGAASTSFWIDPVEDLYAVLMTQFMPTNVYPLTPDFRTLVYQALVD